MKTTNVCKTKPNETKAWFRSSFTPSSQVKDPAYSAAPGICRWQPFNSRFKWLAARDAIVISQYAIWYWLTTQVWKQTSGDPSDQTWNYHGITLLYNFTTALLYMVSSVTMARIVARLLNIYYTLHIKNKQNKYIFTSQIFTIKHSLTYSTVGDR